MRIFLSVLVVILYSGNSFCENHVSKDLKFIAEIRPSACELSVTSSSGLAGEIDFGVLTISEINDYGSSSYLGKKYLRSLRSSGFSVETICDAPSRTAVMFSGLHDRRIVISDTGGEVYAVAMNEVNNEQLGYLSFRLSSVVASAQHIHLPVFGIMSTDKKRWIMKDSIVQGKSDMTYLSVREGWIVAKPGAFKSIKYSIDAELYVDDTNFIYSDVLKLSSVIPLSLVYL